MIWLLPVILAALLLLSRGARRVGDRLVGAAWVTNSASLVVAGWATFRMEPNIGPYAWAYAGLLILAGCTLAMVGAFLLRRIGAFLSSRSAVRMGRLTNRAGLAIGIVIATGATLQARGRPAVGPELAPLVTLNVAEAPLHPATIEAGGLRVRIEITPPLAAQAVTPTFREPEGSCHVVISDEIARADFDVRDLGKFYHYSGSLQCPDAMVTIDPPRRVVHLEQRGPLGSAMRAWRFPGAVPTGAAVWTCRRGRLLEVPTTWLVIAWMGVCLSAIAAVLSSLASRRDSRDMGIAREGMHEGNGLVLFPVDGERAQYASAVHLPIGPVTVVAGAGGRSEPYRAGLAPPSPAKVLPRRLNEFAKQALRRACFFLALGNLALCLGMSPLVVALVGR